jgi:translation initiation factor 3 subunit E
MVDFAMDIYRQIHNTEDVPDEMTDRRKVVISNLTELQGTAAPIVDFLLDENKVKDLRNDKAYNIRMLQDQYNISTDDIEVLFKFAKFQFECGNYSAASDFLVQYRGLCTKLEKSFSALWGKFASEILLQHWNEALEDLNKLQEYIDSKSFSSALAQLQQRIWLIHWSLFVFFNHENGMNFLVDMLMQDRYINAIQTGAPHMLRYLAAAVIINKKRRNVLKELIKLIKSEKYIYSDPVTDFILCLFVDYDFEGAQKKLKECETVLANDYFLTACVDDFVENARLFIFETYCRIHETIDMKMLATKLNMDQESAEKWIANLIRNARLNAKIDSQQGTVVMGSQHPGVYEQIVDKTKNLTARTYHLANAVIGIK